MMSAWICVDNVDELKSSILNTRIFLPTKWITTLTN